MILPVNLGQDSYDITLERGALKCAVEAFGLKNEGRKVMIVTDDGVPPQYANELFGAVLQRLYTLNPTRGSIEEFRYSAGYTEPYAH